MHLQRCRLENHCDVTSWQGATVSMMGSATVTPQAPVEKVVIDYCSHHDWFMMICQVVFVEDLPPDVAARALAKASQSCSHRYIVRLF